MSDLSKMLIGSGVAHEVADGGLIDVRKLAGLLHKDCPGHSLDMVAHFVSGSVIQARGNAYWTKEIPETMNTDLAKFLVLRDWRILTPQEQTLSCWPAFIDESLRKYPRVRCDGDVRQMIREWLVADQSPTGTTTV